MLKMKRAAKTAKKASYTNPNKEIYKKTNADYLLFLLFIKKKSMNWITN